MKNLIVLFFILTVSSFHSIKGQTKTKEVELSPKQLIEIVNKKIELEKIQNSKINDIGAMEISSYHTDENKITHVYVQQTINNIPVYNAVSVFLIKDNNVIHTTPNYLIDVSKRVKSKKPSITSLDAIKNVLSYLSLESKKKFKLDFSDVNKNHFKYSIPEVSNNLVDVSLVYLFKNNTMYLAWNVSLELKNKPNWWNIRVNAINGEVLDKNDYTVECNFENQHQQETQIISPSINIKSSSIKFMAPPPPSIPGYRVYPFPIEAPSFGNSSYLVDPSDAIASPFGWHDTNGVAGADYTITRGNNTYAYDDLDATGVPGYSPDGGVNLIFDFPFDSAEYNPLNNRDASITNLFYSTNKIHDLLYTFGFNESAGNFQQNNYGKGGEEGDYLKAEALDGFNAGNRNNANMSTPPDGQIPRMQTYIWDMVNKPCGDLFVQSNPFNGSMDFNVSTSFGPQTFAIDADLILVDDGVAPITNGCEFVINNIVGKIVLIDRGACSFVQKVTNAQNQGAIGVIIANNAPGNPAMGMGGTDPSITIPVLSVSYEDGLVLKNGLTAGTVHVTMNRCQYPPKASEFDNGIIAHEFMHGVTNRLTGGRYLSGCLSNAEHGGEGWSDWLALILTIKSGDMGTTARSISSFLTSENPNGLGIRRYPYSTNMAVDPLTYANVALDTEIHNIGEVWCSAIWDMSWLLMDQFGYDSTFTNPASGNYIAMKLVLEGLKLQPCSPGFLDSRDAIINADAILYNGAYRCLIWEAFARRGMGYSASQGISTLATDQVESFDMPSTCSPATQLPQANFIVSDAYCAQEVSFTDQSIQPQSWMWDFGDGTFSYAQNPKHTYNTTGVFTIKLVVTNDLGIDSITKINYVNVLPTFSAITSVSDNLVCSGDSLELSAIASGSNYRNYVLDTISFNPIVGSGTVLTLADDQLSTACSIGFDFDFYGNLYSEVYINSNGYITFDSIPSSLNSGVTIPALLTPNNLIALALNDWNPENAGSVIQYYTVGTSPNRQFVVDYNTSYFNEPTVRLSGQIILHETSNIIEIHSGNISANTQFRRSTQGIENSHGDRAVAVPGRNFQNFTASNDAYRFTPETIYSYNWLPISLSGANQNIIPTMSQEYTVEVSDGSGCITSFVTEYVTVISPITESIINTICTNDSIVVNGVTYNSSNPSGTETIINGSIDGCDSTVVINLSFYPQSTIGLVNNTICVNDSIIINGNIYNSLNPIGTEIIFGSNENGCDSTVNINLNVLPALTGSVTNTICNNESIIVNGTTYNAGNTTGIEVFNGIGPNSCDSTVTINLTVEPAIDVTIDNSSMPTLTANQAGASYQWVDCDNGNSPISGETNQTFTSLSNGNFAVEITVGACTEISACENITGVGVVEIENSNVYINPNPTSGLFTISLTNQQGEVNYMITTLEGRIVKQANNVTENNITVDLSNESRGVYLLRINEANTNKVYKIVRQ